MIRKAKAIWRGTGRAGSGNLSTDSGVLADTPYSFRTRFENEKGTNPEELIAASEVDEIVWRPPSSARRRRSLSNRKAKASASHALL